MQFRYKQSYNSVNIKRNKHSTTIKTEVNLQEKWDYCYRDYQAITSQVQTHALSLQLSKIKSNLETN